MKSTTSWLTANGTDRYGFNAKGLGYIYDGVYSGNSTNVYFALSDTNFIEDFIEFGFPQTTFSGFWAPPDDLPLTAGYYVRLIKEV